MTKATLRPGPLPLLGLLTLLLALGLAWMWVDQRGEWRNLTWVAPKPLAPDIKVPSNSGQTSAAAADPAAFAVILDRPVFAPDRRPPPPPAPAPPPDPLANIQIHGIFSGVNAGILARVDGKVRRVKINETVGPWTLKSIDGRDVTFTQGGENRQLRLAYARLDTPAAQGSAPAPKAAATAPAPGVAGAVQRAEDETRERQRRINELLTSRGLPPRTQ